MVIRVFTCAVCIVLAVVGLAQGFAPQRALVAAVGGEAEAIAWVRFVGLFAVAGAAFALAAAAVTPTPSRRIAIAVTLAALAHAAGLALVARGHLYAAGWAAVTSCFAMISTASFALWDGRALRLRAALPGDTAREASRLEAVAP